MRNSPSHVTTVVIVPARNEEARIADCLQALAAQANEACAVVLVANNCDDSTIKIAGQVAVATGLTLQIVERMFPDGVGVGTARRIGCDYSLASWPEAKHLLTTDADCIVASDWITRNEFHLCSAAAVCGLVTPMDSELSVLDRIDIPSAEMESRYEQLVQQYYRHFMLGLCGLAGDHGCAAGASFAVHASAYANVGGFADLSHGEDRDIVRRLKQSGFGTIHAGDVRVAASCRLSGRAAHGMSDALRERAERKNYLIDDALPAAATLISLAATGDLGPWPMHVATQDRLRARELTPHIQQLEVALRDIASSSHSGLNALSQSTKIVGYEDAH